MRWRWIVYICILATRLDAAEPRYIDDTQLLKSITSTVVRMNNEGALKSSKALIGACKGGKVKVELTSPADSMMEPTAMYDSLIKKVLVHCVTYKCDKCTKQHVGCSTTYAIAKDIVVFNYHSISGENETFHAVSDSDANIYAVSEVLAVDMDNDIVIARVAGAAFEPFAIKSGEPVGSPVVVLSNPDDMFYVMTQGNISRYYSAECSCAGKKCNKGRTRWMSITADYAKGSSGAPILNMKGTVIGMVASTHSIYYNDKNHDNLQMVVKNCIPADFILQLLDNDNK